MEITKIQLLKEELYDLKAQQFISTQDVYDKFVIDPDVDLATLPKSMKIARIYAKNKFYKELREAGLLSLNDKFCFIGISRTHTFLWYPFSPFLYVLEKAPFEYDRKAKHFSKKTPIENVPVVRFTIGKHSYDRGHGRFVNTEGNFCLVQENHLLREYYVMHNGISVREDILKAKFVCGKYAVAHRTINLAPMELDKHRPPHIQIDTEFIMPE